MDQDRLVMQQRAAEATELFKEMDTDGSGKLNVNEIGALFGRLGMTLSEKKLKKGFEEIDLDGTGQVSLEEFHRWWARSKNNELRELNSELNRALREANSGRSTMPNSDSSAAMLEAEQKEQKIDRAQMNKRLQNAVFGKSVGDDDMDDVLKRELAMRQEWGGLLHPDTPVRAAYDFLQLWILLYLAWILPNRIAFSKTPKGWDKFTDLLIDMLVWIDMLLSMNMYYYDKKTKRLITDRVKIKKSYMSSWFFVDLFSVLPVDQLMLVSGTLLIAYAEDDQIASWGFVLQEYSQAARMIRLVRLAKLADLLNIEKVVNSLHGLTKNLGTTRLQLEFYFRVFSLIGIMLGAAHMLGSLWVMIGRQNILYTVTASGWMLSAYAQCMDGLGLSCTCGEDSCYYSLNRTKDFVMCIGGEFVDTEWNSIHGSSCEYGTDPLAGIMGTNVTYDDTNTSDTDQLTGILSMKSATVCNPVPQHAPYDVRCSWIQDKDEVEGATGSGAGVGASEATTYLSAFYFTLVTLATVGYGDISPVTTEEKDFVVGTIMLGAFMYAYIIGEFSDLIANIKKEKSKFDAKMRSVNDLLAYIDAPLEVRGKVQDFYEFKYLNKEGIDILDELPYALQVQIVKHRWGKLITVIPFFAGLKSGITTELCKRMKKFTVQVTLSEHNIVNQII